MVGVFSPSGFIPVTSKGKLKKLAAFRVSFYLSIQSYVSRSLARLGAFLHRIGSKIWVELNYIGRLFTFLGRVRNVDDSLTLNNNYKRVNVYYDYVV